MYKKSLIRQLYIIGYNLRKWRKGITLHYILLLIGLGVFIVSFLALTSYALSPNTAPQWTGFGEYENPTFEVFVRAKTLWDWMELMFVPTTLAVGVFLLNYWQMKNSEKLSKDSQRQTILETYLDKMSDLILTHKLKITNKVDDDESQSIARTRTLSTLRQLDHGRKAQLLQFLQESDLISRSKPVVNLSGADFSGAVLIGADLSYAKLNGTSFAHADLRYATIANADLTGARFEMANLEDCDLTNTVLTGANFQGANLKGAIFDGAKLLDINLHRSTAPEKLVTASRKVIANENIRITRENQKK